MANLKIITGENTPILRKKSLDVLKFDAGLKKFAKALKEKMIEADGLGLAAVQVAKNIRVIAVNLRPDSDKDGETSTAFVMVNPEVLSHGDELEIVEEGCLSLPGIFGNVERRVEVVVKFFNVGGSAMTLKLAGLNARIIQHEIDHLDGVLFVDKIKKRGKKKKGVLL